MNLRRAAPVAGTLACLLTLGVLVVPFLVVEGHEGLVSDYYRAGPFGAGAVGFLAALGTVIFLAGEKGNADPETIAGASVVLGLAVFGLALVWWLSLSDALLFSFPPAYAWIEHHPPAVVGSSVLVLGAGAAYATAVVDRDDIRRAA